MRRCLVGLLILAVAACDQGQSPGTTSPSSATETPAPASGPTTEGSQIAPAVASDSPEVTDENVFSDSDGPIEIPEKVVAKIGDTEITTEQFRAVYDLHANKWSARSRNMIPTQDALDRRNIARRLIYHECLRQEAAKLGVEYDKKELEIRVARAKRGVGDWDAHLRWRGESDESIREMLIAELREEAILVKKGELRVTRGEIKSEYGKVKGSWTSDQPRVRASHILVPVGLLNSGGDQRQMTTEERSRWKTKAKADANEIYRKAKNRAVDFGALAHEYGAGGTAAKGGDLGFFTKARMKSDFIEELFELPVGRVSPPIRTDDGYHIVKVTGRYPAGALPLQALEDTLVQRLRDRKLERGRAQMQAELPETYAVVNHLEPSS